MKQVVQYCAMGIWTLFLGNLLGQKLVGLALIGGCFVVALVVAIEPYMQRVYATPTGTGRSTLQGVKKE